jgi:two-component system sensor histidine kinase CiaH
MFHSAALKLTLWYLGIIMMLSIGLSGIIYHLSADALAQNTRRQINFFDNNLTPDDYNSFARLRNAQYDQGTQRLKSNLISFNLMILVAGGAASYLLARRTLEPIEDAMEAQKRFTGDASHELRTPLTVIQAENEVALRNPDLSKKEAVELLKSNLEEVAKLKTLSDGLLKLTNNEGQSLELKPVGLDTVARNAVERWQKSADAKKIKLETDLKKASTLGDQQSLVELTSILLDNAIKYSPDGSSISVSTYRKDNDAYLSVSDKGAGIRATDLPHIFDRFYQADSARSKKSQGGYGLGLAIARQIADVHGAAIEVKSTLGKGSSFTLRLPGV